MKLCDKRDDFDFPIGNFPFICSNIPAAPAHEVNISRACGSYQDFVDRGLQLTWKLLNQGFHFIKLKSSLRNFCGRHHWPLLNICVTINHGYVPPVVSTFRSFPHSWFITGFVTRLSLRVPLVEQELLTLPDHLRSPPVFRGFRVNRSVCVCFVDRCLSFCTSSILNTTLESSNSS
jgi:hypothetical protein